MVDQFPSSKNLRSAFEVLKVERQGAISDMYALIVRPRNKLSRLAKVLGFLAPLLSRMLGMGSVRELPSFAKFANPEKGQVPEAVAILRQDDQTTPFYMMNLNKFYSTAQYGNGENISGERAYNRYASRIAPYLISVGGYPDIMGPIVGVLVGDESSPLHDDWSDFVMVYYPSRHHFLRLMTNIPREGAHHRDDGLQRAVLMLSSDMP